MADDPKPLTASDVAQAVQQIDRIAASGDYELARAKLCDLYSGVLYAIALGADDSIGLASAAIGGAETATQPPRRTG